jgi:TonB-dependent receptor
MIDKAFTAADESMPGKNFQALLKTGVSAAALLIAVAAAPAYAQDAAAGAEEATEEGDAIIVTGFKKSLETAQSRKKESDTIVDSVTAEDIGALPDRSVTETLQRIPGISINRFAAGLDPDHFSVEGSGVVVRGLTYVRSEFNGREAFTANNGRALGFADVPSELLGGVDVFKSPSADRIEGGIAGVVNLRTRLPFDKKGFVLAGSAELNYGDFAKKESPTAAIVASNTWETGIGEIGLLGSFSYSQLFSRADRFQVSSFRVRPIYSNGTRTDVVPFAGATQTGSGLFPRGAVLGTQEFDRERYGYAGAAQWRSNDGDMEATFQFLRSDARQAWTEFTTEIATDNVASNGDSRAVAGTSVAFDDTGLFSSGVITGPTGWRSDRSVEGNLRTPILGLQSNNIKRDRLDRAVTTDYAFNFRWDVSDVFALNFDYQHVDSTVKVRDNTLWTSSYQDANIQLNGGRLPTVSFQAPQNCTVIPCPGTPGSAGGTLFFNDDDEYPAYFTGTHQSFNDPFNSFYRAAMDHSEDSAGNSDAFRIDGDLQLPEDSWLKSLRFGARYADRDQTARFSIYNWGVLSEQWGNGGPVWLDEPVDGIQGGTGGTAPTGTSLYCFDNFFRGATANPLNGQCRPFYNGNTARNPAEYAAYAQQIVLEWQGQAGQGGGSGWTPLALRPGVIPGTQYTPGEVNSVREQNFAAYVMSRYEKEFDSGVKLSGNFGLRYTTTERKSLGVREFASGSLPNVSTCAASIATAQAAAALQGTAQTIPAICALSAAQIQSATNFLNNATVTNSTKETYEYLLPSFNAKLEIGGGVQFRAAYFKGVAPPEFGFVRNYFPVSLNVVTDTTSTGSSIQPTVDAAGVINTAGARLEGTFTAGNPNLRPTTSDNFDLTAEWYFSDVGQLTASLFHKRLNGVLTNDTRRVDITNNGETLSNVITTPTNSKDTGKITGFEISYQQVFDFLPSFLKGFGVQANYTFVKSSGVPQSTLAATDPDVGAGRQSTIAGEDFPLQGLSKHQFNITPFIDIGPISARASYNWRSRYLLTLRDVITPFDPIFQESYGQLDASLTWSVTDQIKIGVQGVNLLNSTTRTTAAVLDQNNEIRFVPRGWYVNDRRYTAIVRFNF